MKHSQVAVGDVELHVVEVGSGKPVLFCHGFPDVWIGWKPHMEAVAAAGYRAIAVDMRGYGRSTGPEDPTAYSPFHTTADLVGLLDALSLPSVTLVGHDFGAVATWYAGMLRPDRFTALFAITVPYMPLGGPSPLEAMEAAGEANRFYIFKQRTPEADGLWADAKTSYPGFLYWSSGSPAPEDRWDPFDAVRPMWRPAPVAVPPWADPEDVAYAIGEFERNGFRKPLNSYRMLQPFWDLAKVYKGVKIHQPAFYLTGETDGVNTFLPVTEDQLREVVPGLRGMHEVPGAGHWVHREEPEVTNGLLLEFLKGLD